MTGGSGRGWTIMTIKSHPAGVHRSAERTRRKRFSKNDGRGKIWRGDIQTPRGVYRTPL